MPDTERIAAQYGLTRGPTESRDDFERRAAWLTRYLDPMGSLSMANALVGSLTEDQRNLLSTHLRDFRFESDLTSLREEEPLSVHENPPPPAERRCPHCQRLYPRDAEHFYIRPGNGQFEYCRGDDTRNCHAAYWSARRSGRRPAGSLRFGIEIEFVGHQTAAEAACIAAGLNCRTREYTHQTTPYWKIVGDGSVVDGGELVSPPLLGEDGYSEVRTACRALCEAGCRVDARCGVHVHLEVRGYTNTQLRNIYQTWYNNQPMINSLVSPSRRNGRWGRDISQSDIERIRRMNARNNDDIQYGLGTMHRYMVINGRAYTRYGTLEVRNHQGSLSERKIIAWARFCRALFTWAVSEPEGGGTLALETLLERLGEHGLPETDQRFLASRAEALRNAERAREQAVALADYVGGNYEGPVRTHVYQTVSTSAPITTDAWTELRQ